jgi:hypothetical protein
LPRFVLSRSKVVDEIDKHDAVFIDIDDALQGGECATSNLWSMETNDRGKVNAALIIRNVMHKVCGYAHESAKGLPLHSFHWQQRLRHSGCIMKVAIVHDWLVVSGGAERC